MPLKLKYVNYSGTKDCPGYWQYRRGGQKFRLQGEFGSTEFLQSYQQIHEKFETQKRGPAGVIPGSLRAVIVSYKNSPEFKTEIEPRTQRDYLRYMTMIENDFGNLPVATMRRRHVKKIRNKFGDTPRTANYIVQVISILMEHAIDEDIRETNPARKVKRLQGGDGHRPWEEQEIELYRRRWALGTFERTAFELGINTGQRGQDLVKMERSHIKSGVISVKQLKTDERVWVPISNDLRVALDAWFANREAWIKKRESQAKPRPVPIDVRLMVLTGDRGRAMTEGRFQHIMIESFRGSQGAQGAKKRKKTGVEGLSSGMKQGGVTTHGLRYTAATRLYELGVSFDDIASITGHETAAMVRKYAKNKRAAKMAIGKLNAATDAQNSNESDKSDLKK